MMISIVVPTYNEEGSVEALFAEIKKYIAHEKFEVIYVDDGSKDGSLTKLKEMSAQHSEVRYVSFSRNFGHQAALRAGLIHAVGDAVISMDADLQHPPKLLPELIEKWRDGYEVVYTIRKDTAETGFLKRSTSAAFYRVLNFLSDLNMEEGAADFRLLDRKVVDLINSQQESGMFLRGYISWIGFRQLGVPYVPAKRFSGASKYTFKKMFALASNGATQFSIKPLHLAFAFAMLAIALSVAYVIYAAIVSVQGHTVPGWASLVALVVFLQGIQFLLLGLIGEYLGRTFMQTKHRPEYIVSEISR